MIYVGPARWTTANNQAQAQAVVQVKKNFPGISVIEQEKVPETADVQRVMESMIEQDGAKPDLRHFVRIL